MHKLLLSFAALGSLGAAGLATANAAQAMPRTEASAPGLVRTVQYYGDYDRGNRDRGGYDRGDRDRDDERGDRERDRWRHRRHSHDWHHGE